MSERSYILFMKEVKGDRDKERKVTYKLPKRKNWGTSLCMCRATKETHTYYAMCTLIAVFKQYKYQRCSLLPLHESSNVQTPMLSTPRKEKLN